MKPEPGLREDVKNLSIVTGSGLLAALLTIGLVGAQIQPAPGVEYTESISIDIEVEPVEKDERVPQPLVASAAPSSHRLYGTVRLRSGEDLRGYIRWDRNEASLTDLLDAYKPRERGGSSVSGIRFGHVDRIDVVSRSSARFTLKSGQVVELDGRATDLGTGMRALLVDLQDGDVAELGWRDLQHVDFQDAPRRQPSESRLFGTLTTRSGMEFTGYVTWDIDEIYSTDILDGDEDGQRAKIPFGTIESIERHSSWASRVTLKDGTEMILDGTNDVDDSIGGISVSDAGLGQVSVEWDEFAKVRFHGAPDPSPIAFNGGEPIRGTVVTASGDELSGNIIWDADEAYTWEMLNGEQRGVDFNVEFGLISDITKRGNGVSVTLLDGRVLELKDSNDVDDGNRGIFVEEGETVTEVDWEDFAELRLGN